MPAQPDLNPTRPAGASLARSHPDVLIAGAGIVGLSLALELHGRGARVTVLEAGRALQQASSAAAGMLAVHDPHNPPALLPLSQLSASLYPRFLRNLESLSGCGVPFQTDTTIQRLGDGRSLRLAEHSLDPRQLAAALLAAVRASGIDLREDTPLKIAEVDPRGSVAVSATGERFSAAHLVYATGAWALPGRPHIRIVPRKGQMLRVQLSRRMPLSVVHRSDRIYIVPRTQGPQAGTALIGATVEDAGFDVATHSRDLAHLRALAAELLPEFASEANAPTIESWAGLRPSTPDGLPVLGRLGETAEFIATGHFRNGILLAPATAVLLADLIEGKGNGFDLSSFAPQRLA